MHRYAPATARLPPRAAPLPRAAAPQPTAPTTAPKAACATPRRSSRALRATQVFVIDPTLYGNAARFMNASCEPSVRPTPLLLRAKLSSNAPGLANAPRVLFVATRDIAAGRRHHPLAPPRAPARRIGRTRGAARKVFPTINRSACLPACRPLSLSLSAPAGEELTWRYNAGAPPKSEKAVKSVYGGRRSQGATRRLPPRCSRHRRAWHGGAHQRIIE